MSKKTPAKLSPTAEALRSQPDAGDAHLRDLWLGMARRLAGDDVPPMLAARSMHFAAVEALVEAFGVGRTIELLLHSASTLQALAPREGESLN